MKTTLLLVVGISVVVALLSHYLHSPEVVADIGWEQTVVPGKLSTAHAFLDDNCEACHTPVQGIVRDNCVVCHANDTHILQRQPTAFHADINACAVCHTEHQGRESKISTMDHSALATIGLDTLGQFKDPNHEGVIAKAFLEDLLDSGRRPSPLFVHPDVLTQEALLNCSTCHANDDRHLTLFGQDCVQCHRTDQWSLPEFLHPSNQSRDCNQCHEAPPSHYMQHFKMISAKVAGEPHAPVEQCFACHQSTSWNDIKRAGWYKHH
ncbi:MAG: hypothetical protein CL693_20190 [Cellvibrionaceae bacterium]|nr:hypothetical protein [Cellvibrionaceae bacterium]|tara:strand:- start:13716 stop:14510 length:795 start_codon:yes stop_codon:yes gene_type:complete